jgi:hypothetical protein
VAPIVQKEIMAKNKTTSDIMFKIQEEISSNKFNSLEEINAHLKKFYTNLNQQPVDKFLGLSPNQMNKIIYYPMELGQGLMDFPCLRSEEINHVPLIRQSLYFLNKLKSIGEVKATQKGNLPKILVRELYEEFYRQEDYFDRTPNTEEDVPEAMLLRSLLEMSGMIKKRSHKFSLTKKGEGYLQSNDLKSMYIDLFHACMNEWNWACLDNYEDLNMIQQSAAFNFYLVHLNAQNWVSDTDLGQIYLEAFPHLIEEVPQRVVWTPEKEVINCFHCRFLERVCKPLGLVEFRKEDKKNDVRETFLRTSSFFKNNFRFNASFSA